jgi:ABC-2 type transport system ATP-binding protein
MSETVLEVKDLIKDYGAYRAVDSISFEIKRGQVMGLLGPNGAGKTTTIQMLTGITNLTSGKISYFGLDFSRQKQAALQRINFTSAYNTLLGRITVKENLLTFAGLYGVKDKMSKIAGLLEKFEISHLADERYINLSAGERTRVNIAKSLLNDPELILMDEPTASLDPDIADKTLTWIEELRTDRNLSILFTSHNMAEVERICDEIIFLDKGKIISRGSPAEHTRKLNTVEVILTYKGSQPELQKILESNKVAFNFSADGVVVIETKKNKTAEIISFVVQAGVSVSDTEVRKPDLEQVFLDIARSQP